MHPIVTQQGFKWRNVALICVCFCAPGLAAPRARGEVSAFHFGEWTLVVPAAVTAETLATGSYPLPVASDDAEFLLYWQNGQQRALALRFNRSNAEKDVAVLRSLDTVQRLKGCTGSYGSSMKTLKQALPAGAATPELPDDTVIKLGDDGRGLRRVGDELIADLMPYRVKIALDSLLVRVGEPGSGDFCRWELSPNDEE